MEKLIAQTEELMKAINDARQARAEAKQPVSRYLEVAYGGAHTALDNLAWQLAEEKKEIVRP